MQQRTPTRRGDEMQQQQQQQQPFWPSSDGGLSVPAHVSAPTLQPRESLLGQQPPPAGSSGLRTADFLRARIQLAEDSLRKLQAAQPALQSADATSSFDPSSYSFAGIPPAASSSSSYSRSPADPPLRAHHRHQSSDGNPFKEHESPPHVATPDVSEQRHDEGEDEEREVGEEEEAALWSEVEQARRRRRAAEEDLAASDARAAAAAADAAADNDAGDDDDGPALIMRVSMDHGVEDLVVPSLHSDPLELSLHFCAAQGLGQDKVQPLAQSIRQQIEVIAQEKREREEDNFYRQQQQGHRSHQQQSQQEQQRQRGRHYDGASAYAQEQQRRPPYHDNDGEEEALTERRSARPTPHATPAGHHAEAAHDPPATERRAHNTAAGGASSSSSSHNRSASAQRASASRSRIGSAAYLARAAERAAAAAAAAGAAASASPTAASAAAARSSRQSHSRTSSRRSDSMVSHDAYDDDIGDYAAGAGSRLRGDMQRQFDDAARDDDEHDENEQRSERSDEEHGHAASRRPGSARSSALSSAAAIAVPYTGSYASVVGVGQLPFFERLHGESVVRRSKLEALRAAQRAEWEAEQRVKLVLRKSRQLARTKSQDARPVGVRLHEDGLAAKAERVRLQARSTPSWELADRAANPLSELTFAPTISPLAASMRREGDYNFQRIEDWNGVRRARRARRMRQAIQERLDASLAAPFAFVPTILPESRMLAARREEREAQQRAELLQRMARLKAEDEGRAILLQLGPGETEEKQMQQRQQLLLMQRSPPEDTPPSVPYSPPALIERIYHDLSARGVALECFEAATTRAREHQQQQQQQQQQQTQGREQTSEVEHNAEPSVSLLTAADASSRAASEELEQKQADAVRDSDPATVAAASVAAAPATPPSPSPAAEEPPILLFTEDSDDDSMLTQAVAAAAAAAKKKTVTAEAEDEDDEEQDEEEKKAAVDDAQDSEAAAAAPSPSDSSTTARPGTEDAETSKPANVAAVDRSSIDAHISAASSRVADPSTHALPPLPSPRVQTGFWQVLPSGVARWTEHNSSVSSTPSSGSGAGVTLLSARRFQRAKAIFSVLDADDRDGLVSAGQAMAAVAHLHPVDQEFVASLLRRIHRAQTDYRATLYADEHGMTVAEAQVELAAQYAAQNPDGRPPPPTFVLPFSDFLHLFLHELHLLAAAGTNPSYDLLREPLGPGSASLHSAQHHAAAASSSSATAGSSSKRASRSTSRRGSTSSASGGAGRGAIDPHSSLLASTSSSRSRSASRPTSRPSSRPVSRSHSRSNSITRLPEPYSAAVPAPAPASVNSPSALQHLRRLAQTVLPGSRPGSTHASPFSTAAGFGMSGAHDADDVAFSAEELAEQQQQLYEQQQHLLAQHHAQQQLYARQLAAAQAEHRSAQLHQAYEHQLALNAQRRHNEWLHQQWLHDSETQVEQEVRARHSSAAAASRHRRGGSASSSLSDAPSMSSGGQGARRARGGKDAATSTAAEETEEQLQRRQQPQQQQPTLQILADSEMRLTAGSNSASLSQELAKQIADAAEEQKEDVVATTESDADAPPGSPSPAPSQQHHPNAQAEAHAAALQQLTLDDLTPNPTDVRRRQQQQQQQYPQQQRLMHDSSHQSYASRDKYGPQSRVVYLPAGAPRSAARVLAPAQSARAHFPELSPRHVPEVSPRSQELAARQRQRLANQMSAMMAPPQLHERLHQQAAQLAQQKAYVTHAHQLQQQRRFQQDNVTPYNR